MAEGERRMLFDIRGRRKHVVRVVYAVLALLMGASLFLVVGPVSIGNLFTNSSTTEASKILNEQAEKAEAKLRREPDNSALLLSVVRTRIAAGNAQTEVNPQTGGPLVNAEAGQSFTQAAEAWDRYLAQADTANPSGAQLMATAFFTLAESATNVEEITTNLDDAAAAQRIVAEVRPNVGALSTLAIYEYLAGDFAAGDKAGKKAEEKATKAEAAQVKEQLAEYRKQGKTWEAEKKRATKVESEQGKEALQNPFGGLGSSSGLGE